MVNQGAVKDHLASRRLQVTLRVSMNINFSTSEAHFVSQISQPPERTQNWFCIQNLPMDLSFQGKKRFVIPWHGSQVTTVLVISENSCVFFYTPCRLGNILPTI